MHLSGDWGEFVSVGSADLAPKLKALVTALFCLHIAMVTALFFAPGKAVYVDMLRHFRQPAHVMKLR